MRGRMMSKSLTITEIMVFADRHHGDSEIVSITADEGLHRTTYRDVFARAARVASVLESMGFDEGDRIATLAWNDHRHLELYYGVSCSGRVLHTVNPRLFGEQLIYIINHAEDRALFFDPMFLPLVEGLADRLPTVERFVALCGRVAMPDSKLSATGVLRDVARQCDRQRRLARARRAVGVGAVLHVRARRAIRKACCTAIARRYCTRMRARSPTSCSCPSATLRCPSCRCFTSMLGVRRTRAR